jgi:hypothetical protein
VITLTASGVEGVFRAAEASAAPGAGTVRRRLLPDFGLDVFVEVRLPERTWALVVGSRENLGDRELVLAAGVTCQSRGGTVEVVAQPGTDTGVFCTLLADLIQYLPRSTTGPAAALVRRIRTWQRMLERGLATGLSSREQAGLFGELLALRELVIPASGVEAVATWVGPLRAPQDFVAGATGLEVKTVSRREAGQCRIANEHQLDVAGLDDLLLVHQVVRAGDEGVSLVELVDELRSDRSVAAQRALFEERLLEAGWLDAHRQQYQESRYSLISRRCFVVEDGFPRIIPTDIPPGVTNVSYMVDLGACMPYLLDEDRVRTLLSRAVSV